MFGGDEIGAQGFQFLRLFDAEDGEFEVDLAALARLEASCFSEIAFWIWASADSFSH